MDADIERRHPDKIIADVLEKEKWLRRDYGKGYKKFGAETVQFQWFLKEELAKASAKAGLYLPIEEVPQVSDKTMRVGVTIIIGMYIRSKLGEYGMEDMFSINAMCYIGFVYSLVLQIFSRLIIKSQLEDE